MAKAMMIITAIASQYAPGVMEMVVNNRINWGQLSGNWQGHYVAVESCNRIGEVIWIRRGPEDDWLPVMIADCSGDRETTNWMRRNSIYLEIDYQLAKEWNTVGHGIGVQISEAAPMEKKYVAN